MRYTSKSSDNKNDKGAISIECTMRELETIEAMLAGACLVGCGRDTIPLRHEIHQPIDLRPDPVTEKHFPLQAPDGTFKFRSKWSGCEFNFTASTYNLKRPPKYLKPDEVGGQSWAESTTSIYVHGLGGYGVHETEMKRRVDAMNAAGFECMRSPRGQDGKYWEVWYLPGPWSAKGPIEGMKMQDILEWLCQQGPGSIDLVRQQFGLSIGD